MQRFRRVLVIGSSPDDTRQLLEDAGRLAERNDGTVELYDVVEGISDFGRIVKSSGGEKIDVAELAVRRRVAELQAIVDSVNVPVSSIEVGFGTSYREIIKHISERSHDLLVLRSDEPTTRRGLAGATTTMHLLRKSPVPVWVARDTNDRTGVAVAVGPMPEAPTSLDVSLLEMASSLARIRGEHLHVIHAWRLEGESMLRSHRLSFADGEVERMVGHARGGAASKVNELLSEVGIDQPHSVHLVKGRPGEVLPTTLDGLRPRVLVMGTLARAGIRGMIIGNVAEQVLAFTDSSVLAAKPEGFVSPVLG